MGVLVSKAKESAQINVVEGVSCEVRPCRRGEDIYQILHRPFGEKLHVEHGDYLVSNAEMVFISLAGRVGHEDLLSFIEKEGMFPSNLNHTASSINPAVCRKLAEAIGRQPDETLVFYSSATKAVSEKQTYRSLLMQAPGVKPLVNFISCSYIEEVGMHEKWICTACRKRS